MKRQTRRGQTPREMDPHPRDADPRPLPTPIRGGGRVWRGSHYRRVGDRCENLFGDIDELDTRLDALWPMPIELADDTQRLKRQLRTLKPAVRAYRQKLEPYIRAADGRDEPPDLAA